MSECLIIEADDGHWLLTEDGRTIFHSRFTGSEARAEVVAWYEGYRYALRNPPRPVEKFCEQCGRRVYGDACVSCGENRNPMRPVETSKCDGYCGSSPGAGCKPADARYADGSATYKPPRPTGLNCVHGRPDGHMCPHCSTRPTGSCSLYHAGGECHRGCIGWDDSMMVNERTEK